MLASSHSHAIQRRLMWETTVDLIRLRAGDLNSRFYLASAARALSAYVQLQIAMSCMCMHMTLEHARAGIKPQPSWRWLMQGLSERTLYIATSRVQVPDDHEMLTQTYKLL